MTKEEMQEFMQDTIAQLSKDEKNFTKEIGDEIIEQLKAGFNKGLDKSQMILYARPDLSKEQRQVILDSFDVLDFVEISEWCGNEVYPNNPDAEEMQRQVDEMVQNNELEEALEAGVSEQVEETATVEKETEEPEQEPQPIVPPTPVVPEQAKVVGKEKPQVRVEYEMIPTPPTDMIKHQIAEEERKERVSAASKICKGMRKEPTVAEIKDIVAKISGHRTLKEGDITALNIFLQHLESSQAYLNKRNKELQKKVDEFINKYSVLKKEKEDLELEFNNSKNRSNDNLTNQRMMYENKINELNQEIKDLQAQLQNPTQSQVNVQNAPQSVVSTEPKKVVVTTQPKESKGFFKGFGKKKQAPIQTELVDINRNKKMPENTTIEQELIKANLSSSQLEMITIAYRCNVNKNIIYQLITSNVPAEKMKYIIEIELAQERNQRQQIAEEIAQETTEQGYMPMQPEEPQQFTDDDIE